MYFVGFDPGGKGNFGWAVLRSTAGGLELIEGGTCSDAPAAIDASSEVMTSSPNGVGVDAPLYWTFRGDRRSDVTVRAQVRNALGHGSTVGHVNSLRGACLVQGVLVAHLASGRWPSVPVTEAHPKALLRVSDAARDWVEDLAYCLGQEHVRDAALAAFAAHAFVSGASGWRDLMADEDGPYIPWAGKVSYYFPVGRE